MKSLNRFLANMTVSPGSDAWPKHSQRRRRATGRPLHSRVVAAALVLLLPLTMVLPVAGGANAVVAPTGQGFTVTPSDLAFILKQIKISEAHVANTTSETGPCGALVGTGPNQISSPLVSQGLRTVDGSCNNLQPGQETFGASGEIFPRLAAKSFRSAEPGSMGGPPAPSSYEQKSGNVFDSQPRVISNLIVDQTSTNPAAVAAAGFPARSQGNAGVVPCTTDPDKTANPPVAGVPAGCVPTGETLFIPNITTDVGLSPPFNSLFTLFGQFFDHGIDQTVKGGSGTVFVPLKNDDPLVLGPDRTPNTADDLDPNLRFMVLTRGQNQPGPDGILGNADDVQDALNTDTPWVDQSQTYTSNPSHQVFLREYVNNSAGRPVSTGTLLGGPAGPTAEGMSTWATLKDQAASLLGLRLEDRDALDVPMLAVDPYGKFIPGPARGLPQYVTASGLVEGNTASPVPVPADVRTINIPFLTDIANNAVPKPGFTPDPDNVVTPSLTPCARPNFPAGCVNQYDDEILNLHFTAGDGRVNENIGLTAVHQVFHAEHNRLVDDIKNILVNDTSAAGVKALAEWKSTLGAGGWNGERLFQAARFITEMEYQHLVFEEFARKVQPAINPFIPTAFTMSDIDPAVKAEFAHAVYRFGHSMLTETISRRNEDQPGPDTVFGTSDDIPGSQNDISLLKGFLNPPAYTDGGPAGPLTSKEAAGSVFMGMADQTGNEIDEFVTETLRNNLLGLPLDLATINITRARSEGVPRLNEFRRELFGATSDPQLTPYINWIDFGENLKNPSSIINFIAAYGKHPSITGATTLEAKRNAARLIVSPNAGEVPPDDAGAFMNSTGAWANTGTRSITGLDDVDLWIGGLAESTNLFGGLLGSTFNFVFEAQMTDLQNGDRLYYLARTTGMNLRTQLEGNSFSELVMRNTNAKAFKADPFATSDCKFELKNLAGTPEGFTASGNTVANDPASECDETALLLRQPDGTIKYRAKNTVDPAGINGQSVFNGTAAPDRVYGGADSDTFWGNEGNDVIEGGDGADVVLGGEGNDRITDLNGDDVLKGGPGNDAMDGGPGLDLLMGGEGKDFTNGGANANITFAGGGDDFMILGEGTDNGIGDSGDDWMEGGGQVDGLRGDSASPFFTDDNKPGNDILIGQSGDDDYDGEGGDDIGLAGPGIEKYAGSAGYDWMSGVGDPQRQNADLTLVIPPLDILTTETRDRFDEVEALSGWKFDDILRGDNFVPSTLGGGGDIGCDALDQPGLDRVAGLDALVPPLATPVGPVIAASMASECPLVGPNVWGEGNILLGGVGSDLLEGRGADDILDGDAYLNVRLSVRTNAADPATEIGSADVTGPTQSAMNAQYLRDASGNLTGPTLQQDVFAGKIDPGNIVAVREVLTPPNGTSIDSAQFSDLKANYDVTTVGGVMGSPGAVTTVVHARGTLADGTDTLRNVERLVFSDSVAPGAPTIGVATAGNTSATVRWTEPVGAVSSYSVRVVDSAGVPVGALRPAAADATSLVVTGLTNGQSYRFQVQATNTVGTGPFSALSNAVTPATVPGAPAIGAVTGGNATATVNWTAPASDGGSAITSYSVRVVNAAGTQVGALRTAAATATSLTVTGLTNGQAYRFQVQATNAAGAGAFSALSAAVTPATVPGAPTIGTATGGNAAATVNWTAPASNGGSAITGYSVRVVNAAGTQVGALRPAAATATSLAVTGLTNGQAYRFQVQATNAVGTGAFSALSVAVTPSVTAAVPAALQKDMTGDGRNDLIVRNSAGALLLYPGNGTGGFQASRVIGSGWNSMNAILMPGDFSGDGRSDVISRDATGRLFLYPGTGTGTLGAGTQIGSGWGGFTALITPGDFNGDGRVDLLARDAGGQLLLYPGNGASGFGASRVVGTGWNGFTSILGVGDFSGDARADLMARDSLGRLFLYPGNGTGGFGVRTQPGSGWNGLTIVGPRDFNGDNRADIIARDGSGGLFLYGGNGTGGFVPRVQNGTGWQGFTLMVQ